METPYLDDAIRRHEKALSMNMLSDGGKEALNEFKAIKQALRIHDVVVGRSEQCRGCEESSGETKLWCCNHCGKRIEDF